MPTATLRRSRRADAAPRASGTSSSAGNANEATPALGTSAAAAPWNSYDEDRQRRRWQWIAFAAAVAVVGVGIGCALALYFPLHAVETSRFRDEFKSACEQNVRLLDVAFNRQLAGTLLNAAAYVSSVPNVREEALVMYANNSSLDRNTTFSLSNAPVLSYDQLAQIESHYGRTVWPKPLPPKDAVLVDGRPILSPVLFMCD
ncbi:hypothetical protein AMAG_19439 [Allomyces macrogynus ATCC 38327]|uniref:Uncharacterized protein n=1 Tax=Allomyces macrogynus (strain ATCC 38327) TaxID=578462 RepID=A0A0L0SRL3_ALLM3|nr:hypothetical protein AMAG_19439 [Allomyces macrogynus ATCC 38327]|eukprot:KNE65203.1 hypothetical protein AMAG_19439 [Allomyces macrogynus ATCC 38327]